jgi:hypothetical protein
MKKILLLIIYFFFSILAFAGEISTKIEVIKEKDYKVTLVLNLTTGQRILKNFTYDEYSSILLTNDERFLIISSGTDIVGYIEIYELKKMEKIVSEGLRSYDLKLNSNTLEYIACLWYGMDFSICENHRFQNGKVEVVNQYVGTYHSLGPPYAALSVKYKLVDYDIDTCIKYFADEQKYYKGIVIERSDTHYQPIEIRKLLINTILPNKSSVELTKNDIFIYLTYCLNATKLFVTKYKNNNYGCIDLFNAAYPVLDFYTNKGIISKLEHNDYVMNYLKILGIKTTTVPWLIKK